MKMITALMLALTLTSASAQTTDVIRNPVLPEVADAGIIKFNGQYYLGGVFTNGSLYTSADLINWKDPRKVFSMNNEWATPWGIGGEQIHSNDINYVNGIFHLYWNVNYWSPQRNIIHIGHATSRNILGPFTEPVKSTWFDSRLDPKLFVDDDGKMYFYSVKFSEGNAIWVTPMKNAGMLGGQPQFVFASLPHTWETIDNRVEEGPWVSKYRDRYYMLFNANHTATEWGNYAIGAAEALRPLTFNNGNKYAYPVLQSNQVELEESYADVLKYQGTEGALFRYTFNRPPAQWNSSSFSDSAWASGQAAFGSRVIKGSTARKVKSIWNSGNIWIRKRFLLDDQVLHNFSLRIHHDGHTRVFVNEKLVYDAAGRNYLQLNLDSSLKSALQEGENLLAVESSGAGGSSFVDVSLFDMKNERADDILFSPGQASMIKGPDGLEWWLVYMANKNDEKRGQFISRIHFWNRKLTIDGITADKTTGEHAPPAAPAFNDLFADSTAALQTNWNMAGGRWNISDQQLSVSGSGHAIVSSTAATNYIFEASLKPDGQHNAGVYAWWKDPQNWGRMVISAKSRSWIFQSSRNGQLTSRTYRLQDDFDYTVYHQLGVAKNGNMIGFSIDDRPAPGKPTAEIALEGKALPGLFTDGGITKFDGVLYTIGWDEYDEKISGWKAVRNGLPAPVSGKGIESITGKGEWAVFKGDRLNSYEFAVQVASLGGSGSAGLYPLYLDSNNYVKAVVDYQQHKLVITGKIKGMAIAAQSADLSRSVPCYADVAESDFMEQHFKLDDTVLFNGLHLNGNSFSDEDPLPQNIPDRVNIFYRHGSQWFNLGPLRSGTTGHPAFQHLSFDPVQAEELKFVNKDPSDHHVNVYRLRIDQLSKSSYNLRITRKKGTIVFFVDNKEAARMKDIFPASGVGLYTSNMSAAFNGITLIGLPVNR